MAGAPPYVPGHEGDNPTRRYKWFRPRQAAWGFAQISAPTNFGTVSLYNNSGGAQYLVLRDWRAINISNNRVSMFYAVGAQGSSFMSGQSFMPDQPQLPGVCYDLDAGSATSTAFKFDQNVQQAWWPHDFPLAILPPGWSICFQNQSNATFMGGSFMWEAIFADELDFMW
jgi:hypothetical protein